MSNDNLNNRGFTLIETLVVIGITVLLTLIFTRFQVDVFSLNSFMQNSLTAESQARTVLKKMVREVREATSSSGGAYPIASVGRSSLTFFSDVDFNGQPDQIRYFVNGSTLKKGVIKPTGTPSVYTVASEVVTSEVINLVSTSTDVFQYFNNSTSAPMSFPINISSIRAIRFDFTIDADPNRTPTPMNFSSQVSIRNLKDNF